MTSMVLIRRQGAAVGAAPLFQVRVKGTPASMCYLATKPRPLQRLGSYYDRARFLLTTTQLTSTTMEGCDDILMETRT